MIAAIYPRTVLLASVSLLTLTTTASAQSAWVLWLGTGTTYTPFGAYGGNTGERECKDTAAQAMADLAKDTKRMAEFLRASSRYLCLPDTVDPRAPKGPTK